MPARKQLSSTYQDVQAGAERAGYGKVLIPRLAADLTRRFGRGFYERNLEQMRQFYLGWPIPQTVSAKFFKSPRNSDLKSTPDLHALAKRFPLPCSAYFRLLSGCASIADEIRP